MASNENFSKFVLENGDTILIVAVTIGIWLVSNIASNLASKSRFDRENKNLQRSLSSQLKQLQIGLGLMETSANEALSNLKADQQAAPLNENTRRSIKFRMRATRLPPDGGLQLTPSLAKILAPENSDALAKILVWRERCSATAQNLEDSLSTTCGIDVVNECLHRVAKEARSCRALVDGLQKSLEEKSTWHGRLRRLHRKWQRSFSTKRVGGS